MSLQNMFLQNKHLRPFENMENPIQMKSLTLLIRPLIFVLKIVGAYHCHDDGTDSAENDIAEKPLIGRQRYQKMSWRIYSLCWVCVSVALYIWRALFLFWNADTYKGVVNATYYLSRLYGRILWSMIMVVITITMFLASFKRSGLARIFQLWREMRFYPTEVQEIESYIKRFMWIELIVLLSIVVYEITANTVESVAVENVVFFPAILPFILGFFVEGTAICFLLLLARAIIKLFSVLNKRVSVQFRQTGTIPSLDNFVHNYYLVVEMVSLTDRIFCFYLGAYIVYYIVWVIFKIYIILNAGFGARFIVFTWLWLVVVNTFSLSLLWSGAEIPLKATDLFLIVHAVPLKRFSFNQQAKLLSLQHFMGNTTVSLTLFKMHPITRGLITSIVGFCLTYLFILIQFHSK